MAGLRLGTHDLRQYQSNRLEHVNKNAVLTPIYRPNYGINVVENIIAAVAYLCHDRSGQRQEETKEVFPYHRVRIFLDHQFPQQISKGLPRVNGMLVH